MLATPSFDIGLSNENHFAESSERSTGAGVSKSISRSFTLSDPDVDDEFDVEVMNHLNSYMIPYFVHDTSIEFLLVVPSSTRSNCTKIIFLPYV